MSKLHVCLLLVYSNNVVVLFTCGCEIDLIVVMLFCLSLLVMKAVETYGKMLIDRTTEEIFSNFARVWRELAHESQFRWV